jgi:N,N-dimethylformamidase
VTAALIGYADRISVRAGEKIAFKVSSTGTGLCEASLIRIVRGDPNPAGPGVKFEDLSRHFSGSFTSRQQHAWPGSYALIEGAAKAKLPKALSVEALIWPTLPGDPAQAVVSRRDPESGDGFALLMTPDGMMLEVSNVKVTVGRPLRPHTWYRVWASADPTSGILRVGQQPLRRAHAIDDEGEATMSARTLLKIDVPKPLMIGADAAADRPARHCFNGKIEAPSIAGLGTWDFARRMDSLEVEDTGPNALHGTLINLPTRAMKGAAWDGSERNWKHAPHHYAAIHFHDDDLHDCGWEDDFSFTVPKDVKSGVYGIQLSCGADRDIIPFFVRPETGKPTAKVVYLASTFTYQVYSNFARVPFNEPFRKRVAEWKSSQWHPSEHKDYGLSTYDSHRDGSGVAYSSHRRPLMTWRPNFLAYNDPRGSGMRHIPADSHLTGWLDRMGVDFDVITDHDLHAEGAALLEPYNVVLTGTHPEYHTVETLDALTTYTETGGRLMYLGGNGFYWRVALSDKVPGAIEIRRTEGGIRLWAAEPGEYYHSFDGAYGGLWRRSDRAPNKLAGIGFSSQGTFWGDAYRRASRDNQHAWVFDGVKDELFGGYGFSGGGAAGFELDRLDYRLGSPLNSVILATSEGHDRKNFVVVHEERLGFDNTINGQTLEQLIRADMVHVEKPEGGAIFSVGSITYCGSLPAKNYDNDVSRLTFNVLNRFGELGLSWPFPPKA